MLEEQTFAGAVLLGGLAHVLRSSLSDGRARLGVANLVGALDGFWLKHQPEPEHASHIFTFLKS